MNHVSVRSFLRLCCHFLRPAAFYVVAVEERLPPACDDYALVDPA